MAVTIQQIADLAGVSRGTVDRALNHRGRVKPEVAKRIEDIADELGYVTRTESREREAYSVHKKIGVVTYLSKAAFMIEMNRGIRDAEAQLQKQGVQVLLREVDDVDEAAQQKMVDELVEAGIDGLVIMPVAGVELRQHLSDLATERHLPIITLNADMEGIGRLCFVGMDNRRSGQAAAYLMGMMTGGSGRVLGITSHFSNSSGSMRMDGFVSELEERYPDIELVGVQCSFDKDEEVERIIVNALTNFPDLKGILITSSGHLGVERALHTLKLKKRPYIIMYDLTPKNTEYLENETIDFVIDQACYSQGARAVSMMADYLVQDKKPPQNYVYTDINIKTKYNL